MEKGRTAKQSIALVGEKWQSGEKMAEWSRWSAEWGKCGCIIMYGKRADGETVGCVGRQKMAEWLRWLAKKWQSGCVGRRKNGRTACYIDLHFLHGAFKIAGGA